MCTYREFSETKRAHESAHTKFEKDIKDLFKLVTAGTGGQGGGADANLLLTLRNIQEELAAKHDTDDFTTFRAQNDS